MNLCLFACLISFFLPRVQSALPADSFYSSNGQFTNNCAVTSCRNTIVVPCSPGQYRSGCGNSNAGTNYGGSGVCQQCTSNTKLNWGAWTTYVGALSDAECAYSCAAGSTKDANGVCQISGCPALNDNSKEYIPGAAPPSCVSRCAAGYSGTYSASGYTCTLCAQGTYSVQGSTTTCTPCATGTYSTQPGRTTTCDGCTGNTYAPYTGMTACTPCPICASGTGFFQSGCGGSNAGSCAQCTN